VSVVTLAQTSESVLVLAPASGLMGLAFESSAVTKATPFWEAASVQEMSFWLANDHSVTETSVASGGVFTLGGTNSSLFSGDIEFHDLASTPSVWVLRMSSKYSEYDVVYSSQPLSGLTVNGAAITLSTNPLSVIDTMTTLIGGPHDDVFSLYNAIPGSVDIGIEDPGFFAFRMLAVPSFLFYPS
jgi:cathepsin D